MNRLRNGRYGKPGQHRLARHVYDYGHPWCYVPDGSRRKPLAFDEIPPRGDGDYWTPKPKKKDLAGGARKWWTERLEEAKDRLAKYREEYEHYAAMKPGEYVARPGFYDGWNFPNSEPRESWDRPIYRYGHNQMTTERMVAWGGIISSLYNSITLQKDVVRGILDALESLPPEQGRLF